MVYFLTMYLIYPAGTERIQFYIIVVVVDTVSK